MTPEARIASTPGDAAPLGATVKVAGVNFSVFSKCATGIELLLFDGANDAQPTHAMTLDPAANRQYHYCILVGVALALWLPGRLAWGQPSRPCC